MKEIKELARRPSPAGRPQPLAYRDQTLWIGSWETNELYAVDPQSWKVRAAVAAPGKPFGMAFLGDELRVVVSNDDDDRFFYRFVPGKGFDAASKTPCPEHTGSHLASDGTTLYLTQLHLRRMLAFDANGTVLRTIALPTQCGGIGIRDGVVYMISTDAEFENLTLATLDIEAPAPQATPIAALPDEARALTFDGNTWWTSLRERNELLAFDV